MTYTFLQLFSAQRILLPSSAAGWLVWLGFLALIVLVARWSGNFPVSWDRRQWARLALLVALTPLSILIFTLRLPADGALPIPDLGAPAIGPLLAPLAALPWLIAFVWFGPAISVAIAGFSGLLIAVWDTRSPFTLLEISFLAAMFVFLLKQRYRTSLFGWLRRPIGAGLFLTVLYPLIYLGTSLFWVSTNPLISLDFAVSHVLWTSIAIAAPLLLAAAALQLVRARWPALAPAIETSLPAPSERSLEARFLFTLGPVVLLAFLVMGALAWWSAGRTAEQLYADSMGNNLEIAADSVPFVLETGQNLILRLAGDTRLADPASAEAAALLQAHLSEVPYFEQMTLLDTGGNAIAGVPVSDFRLLAPGPDELNAISLAIQGVSLQLVSVHPPNADSTSAQLLFVASVRNSNNQVRSVLIGRTTLSSNPFAQAIVQALRNIDSLGGQGLLIDGGRLIVMAPFAAAVLQPFNGRTEEAAVTYQDVSADGSRLIVHYQPISGSNWGVVARWPARLSQQLALSIALPMLGVLLLLALVAYGLLRISLRSVAGSLQELARETKRIADGDLEAPLSVSGADEVGRLGSAFETMRRNLHRRVEETQRLLELSQGISSNLEVRSHIDPILDAALAGGASIARLIFASENRGNAIGFGKGAGNEKYESLDAQILSLTLSQPRVLLSNPARARLKFDKGTAPPESLAAFALNDQMQQLGALWLAYDKPQNFTPDAVHYLETLASQAAAAAANARLYVSAKVGQQRLESVLMAEPNAILLTDAKQNLVFVNTEAAQILHLNSQTVMPTPIQSLLDNRELLALFAKAGSKSQEAEVRADGRAYLAKVSPIWSGPELIGFTGMLSDVTKAKQIDAARVDFLGTVGHDLQDPLELMRGYLSMLSMVGELNSQQSGYVQKIEHNIENISRLASNLLAAERLQVTGGLKLETFAIQGLLQDAIDEIGPRARQKKVELVLKPSRSAPVLEADRVLLQRAFYNLLDNAVRFSPQSEAVAISCDFSPEAVTVSLKDAGPGIARVDMPRLFDGGEKATGLTIARSIVERHNGRVWAESKLGAGSTFFCLIPLRQPKRGTNENP